MILEPIYLYCERSGPGWLGEPFNLVAGFALLGVAVAIRTRLPATPALRALSAGIVALFLATIALHTAPSHLTVALTIASILAVLLIYFHAVNRLVLGLSPVMALACTLLILPFAAVSLPLIAVLKGAASSVAFSAFPVLLLGYAAALRQEHPQTARGLFLAGAVFVLSMAVRTLDMPMCGQLPHGLHFVWILGVALTLWLLARVLSAHMLAGQAGGR